MKNESFLKEDKQNQPFTKDRYDHLKISQILDLGSITQSNQAIIIQDKYLNIDLGFGGGSFAKPSVSNQQHNQLQQSSTFADSDEKNLHQAQSLTLNQPTNQHEISFSTINQLQGTPHNLFNPEFSKVMNQEWSANTKTTQQSFDDTLLDQHGLNKPSHRRTQSKPNINFNKFKSNAGSLQCTLNMKKILQNMQDQRKQFNDYQSHRNNIENIISSNRIANIHQNSERISLDGINGGISEVFEDKEQELRKILRKRISQYNSKANSPNNHLMFHQHKQSLSRSIIFNNDKNLISSVHPQDEAQTYRTNQVSLRNSKDSVSNKLPQLVNQQTNSKEKMAEVKKFKNLRYSVDNADLKKTSQREQDSKQNESQRQMRVQQPSGSPQHFKQQVDKVVKDETLMRGYKEASKGDDQSPSAKLYIYQQDFEVKVNKMNQHLEEEFQQLAKSFENAIMIIKPSLRGAGLEPSKKENIKQERVSYSQKKRPLLQDFKTIDSSDKQLSSQIMSPTRFPKKQRSIVQSVGQKSSILPQIVLSKIDTSSQISRYELSPKKSRENLQSQESFNTQKGFHDFGEQENENYTEIEAEIKLQEQIFIQKLSQMMREFQLQTDLENSLNNRHLNHSSSRRSISPQFDNGMKNIKEQSIEFLTHEMTEKQKFYEMCKQSQNPVYGNDTLASSHTIIVEKINHDPKLNYFLECTHELVLAVPTISRIHNKQLSLTGYKLSQGICKGLRKYFESNKNAVSKIAFDNNGLKESFLCQILHGLFAQDELKQIVISRNVIDEESSNVLQKIVKRIFPKNLDELRIINCKIHCDSTRALLQTIREQPNLRKLSLIKASLNQNSLDLITELIQYSRQIIDLDLSWNGLRSFTIKGLLKAISTNRCLQSLNLSWNNLMSPQVKDSEYENLLIESLSRFIKYNRNLLHLDLSYTRLGHVQVSAIGETLRKAKTLVAIHFTGNPGVTQEVKDFLQQRLVCKDSKDKDYKREHQLLVQFNQMSPRQVKVYDGLQLKQIQSKKRLLETQTAQAKIIGEDQKLIFQRQLGHKAEIPRSGQWQMITQEDENCQCWACNKWVYTLVFWSKSIQYQLADDCDLELIESIMEMSEPLKEENSDAPQIVGSFTNWETKQMIPIQQFCKAIDHIKVDPIMMLKKQGRLREEVTSELQLNQKELALLKSFSQSIEEDYKVHWKYYINKNVKYKRACYLNSLLLEDVDPKTEQIYIYVCFARPGQHIYMIEDLDKEQNILKCIVPLREDDIIIYEKSSKFKIQERVFKKDTSVFKEWREDTPASLNLMLLDDFKFWKLHRFIKDDYDRDRCEQIIRKNIELIKKIFMTQICKSSFPNISWIDFSNFCEKCKIFDKNVNIATIDRIFIATNVEIGYTKNEDNPDKALCRYEFYEILVRIAQAKFKDPDICKTYSESLQKLLDENIFPNAQPDPWQEFRDEELWTMDVNDILEANLEGLKQVYQFYWEPRKKYMTIQDTLNLIMRDTELGLIEKDAIYCYGMSKMTVILESENSSQYRQLKFVELLELIGRIAILKFKDTENEGFPLAKKIEYVLDALLQLVEVQRKDVNIVVNEQSESDDEY